MEILQFMRDHLRGTFVTIFQKKKKNMNNKTHLEMGILSVQVVSSQSSLTMYHTKI